MGRLSFRAVCYELVRMDCFYHVHHSWVGFYKNKTQKQRTVKPSISGYENACVGVLRWNFLDFFADSISSVLLVVKILGGKIMKNVKMFLAGVMVILSFICHANTTNFFTNVTNLWYQGYKSNVLEIAEQRLSVNSNDIAGLILKLEFEIEFLEFSSFSNTAQRVFTVGETIASTNFVREFSEYTNDVHTLLLLIPHYPMNEIAADKQKALISNKPLSADDIIEALQDDGYFQ